MTSQSSRTRVHRPAESALAVPEVALVPETVAAATLSSVGLPREEDGCWALALVLRLELEAGSDLLGRSIANSVEGAA